MIDTTPWIQEGGVYQYSLDLYHRFATRIVFHCLYHITKYREVVIFGFGWCLQLLLMLSVGIMFNNEIFEQNISLFKKPQKCFMLEEAQAAGIKTVIVEQSI